MLNENKAREIVESIKGESAGSINYLGIQLIPSITSYALFPDELKSKVHVFEALDKGNNHTICQYYVNSNGSIYKDTYPMDLNCIKIK